MRKYKTIIGPPKVRCIKCESCDLIVRQTGRGCPVVRRYQCLDCGELFNVVEPDERLSNMLWAGIRTVIHNCVKRK